MANCLGKRVASIEVIIPIIRMSSAKRSMVRPHEVCNCKRHGKLEVKMEVMVREDDGFLFWMVMAAGSMPSRPNSPSH